MRNLHGQTSNGELSSGATHRWERTLSHTCIPERRADLSRYLGTGNPALRAPDKRHHMRVGNGNITASSYHFSVPLTALLGDELDELGS